MTANSTQRLDLGQGALTQGPCESTPGRRLGADDRRPLAEFEAEAQGQLVLLDFSVSVDVAVIQQQFSEAVQLRATDAGLKNRTKHRGLGTKHTGLTGDSR